MARPNPTPRNPLVSTLARIPLSPVASRGVRMLGYDPTARMVAVVFQGTGDVVYGYPHLTDDEIRGLLEVMENHESLGHYVSKVIKPNHDDERVRIPPED
jgi:hypothetical protein